MVTVATQPASKASPVTCLDSESIAVECEVSARFWTTHIGRHAQRMRERADAYAIIAALLSTLTGLGVWTTLAASTQWPAVLAVSVVSLAAAVVAVIPKLKGYGECAEKAAPLGPRYAEALTKLTHALDMHRRGHPDGLCGMDKAVDEFHKVREAKEALKPYPTDLQQEIDALRARMMA